MKQHKLLARLILIWVGILAAILLLDALVLQNPIGNSSFAQCRLVLPSIRDAKSLNTDMTLQQVTQQLGAPNGSNPYTGTGQTYWDLQFGARLWIINYGSGNWSPFITPPLIASARWLALPGIMGIVTVIEFLIYRKLRRKT